MVAVAARRARLMFWLRLVISLGLIVVLVHKAPDLGQILPRSHPASTVVLLAIVVLATLGGVVLSAWRWKRVLGLFAVDVPVAALTRHYLAGLFVGNVLPSTIGGDVLRVSRASADTGSSEVAFASVALERLTGFVALPLLVLCGFIVEPSLTHARHAWVALVIAGVTLVLLIVIVFLAGHPRAAGRYADHASWKRFIGAVHKGVDALRRDPRQALSVVVAALAYQASVVVSVALVATALDIKASTASIIAFAPAVAMVQVLPISLMGGLGVREGMFVFFLTPLGVSRGQAIAVGLLWYASVLVVSLLGAPALAAGRTRTTRTRPEPEPVP